MLPHQPASFPLTRIRLGASDFKAAQDASIRYILELDADRLCAPYLHEAGLESPMEAYGNWESDGLGGHIGGHYASACAQLYAATGDARLLERLEYIVDVFQSCQQAGGDGYLGGVPGGRSLGKELATGTVNADLFTLNGRWVPLYNLHKTFAGLLDTYSYAGLGRALGIATRLADWWLGISDHLNDDVFEQMLHTEFGGMNDAFAILGGFTGRDDFLAEARRFSHRALLEPLAGCRDELDGLHANTQIPKVVGYARLAASTGDVAFGQAADFFWDTVLTRRTVSIGGNSVREHFHPANDFASMVQDEQGPETCNTYNMLKLAKLRFERTGDPAAIDFYERATYNHILSSQHPGKGGFVYFTPLRPAHYRVYSKAQESMWCCVGSGLENHARYAELIYSHQANALCVNLYIASELNWAERGILVRLDTDFPHSDVATLVVTAVAPTEATILLRRPGWALSMDVDITGSRVTTSGSTERISDAEPSDGVYVPIHRTWEGVTKITVQLKTGLRCEPLPDGSPWVSFLYGPIVLAARAGAEGILSFEAADERTGHIASGPRLPLSGTTVVANPDPIKALLLRDRTSITAQLTAIDAEGNVRGIVLEPFAGIHDARYTLYWPAGPTTERFAALQALDEAAAAQCKIVDAVAAGEQQPESDHAFRGESTRAGGKDGRHWRNAAGWFSYTLTDRHRQATLLRVRFRAGGGPTHELRLNGTVLTGPVHCARESDHDVTDFSIPEEVRNIKDGHLVFAVHAQPGSTTGDLLSVQLLKAV
ncbi:beta-L-arabinofuranosidase domain-containing protein [Pseudarthrobacter oxydans]|uniref:beta-L-arabinofuranosidase domain-containing protein n=1 Tax=Pseudarthrobacter oxydans TaxID=1671 RepID=UPI00380996D6